jgi:hypothetical protein
MEDNIEFETPNKSYPVDLTIPMSCSKYAIRLVNNVFHLTLTNGLTSRMLETQIISKKIDHAAKQIDINCNFKNNEGHIYNYILDRSDISTDDLILAMIEAKKYFEYYEITRRSQHRIDTYINRISIRYENVLKNLTSKPDYNLTLFKSRLLPYYDIECKDWVKANIDSIRRDYPTEVISADNKNDKSDKTNVRSSDDYHEEKKLAAKHNNFLEWNVLPISKYPNIDKLLANIKYLFDLEMKSQALLLSLKLMISPRDCHIIKSPALWNMLADYMADKNFEEIVKYCYSYAMYILRQEETIMFNQINILYRVVITLDEATNMPGFQNSHIDKTPYILQLTDDTQLYNTMPFYLRGKRSINNMTEFNRRFNIATGGAFKGVDFKKLSAAITGSILVPCVQTSPLEVGFEDLDWDRERSFDMSYPYMIDTPEQSDMSFINFLEYYYPSYVSLNDKDYREQVLCEKKNTLTTDISDLFNEITYENTDIKEIPDIKSENVAECSTSGNKVLLESEQENKTKRKGIDYNQLADIDISITTLDMNLFKENALKLYNAICANCNHRGPVHIKEIKTLASTKYKIYGPGISRPIDIFRIPYDPIKMVKKFHVHAVKMFYDGSVTMFRSCLSCLLSGVGESYKWFSCNKVAADVLLKYTQRGFTIILNEKERNAISSYIKKCDRWGPMFETLQIDTEKIYCVVTEKHPFFRPGLYESGCRKGLRNFERDTSNLYANTLVVSATKTIFPFGEIIFKDTKKIYPPNDALIRSAVNYMVDKESYEDGSESD